MIELMKDFPYPVSAVVGGRNFELDPRFPEGHLGRVDRVTVTEGEAVYAVFEGDWTDHLQAIAEAKQKIQELLGH